MATKNKVKITRETILIIVGSLLLIIAFLLFHYDKILEISDAIYNEIQTEIYKETTRDNNSLSVDVDVDYISDNNNSEPKEDYKDPNYIGFLEIPKINLYQGFLSKSSYYNNVDYHVEILDISDFPDVVGGNFILAAHSGNSYLSYFHNLYKLNLGDTAKVYYQSKVYNYKIIDIYKEKKDGSVNIYRDPEKTTLTLITCTRNDKNTQTIYILELIGVETY